jgi:hypothetical protein
MGDDRAGAAGIDHRYGLLAGHSNRGPRGGPLHYRGAVQPLSDEGQQWPSSCKEFVCPNHETVSDFIILTSQNFGYSFAFEEFVGCFFTL